VHVHEIEIPEVQRRQILEESLRDSRPSGREIGGNSAFWFWVAIATLPLINLSIIVWLFFK